MIPVALGGTKTVPLCERCHGLVHDRGFTSISALTKKAMSDKRARGEHNGGRPPYGYRLLAPGSMWIVTDDHEQKVIAVALELRAAGRSLREIANALYEQGYRSRSGRPFQATQVMRMVKA